VDRDKEFLPVFGLSTSGDTPSLPVFALPGRLVCNILHGVAVSERTRLRVGRGNANYDDAWREYLVHPKKDK